MALIETLTDDFGSLDTAKWTATNTNGTVSIISGQLDLTTNSSAGSHATITSVDVYDFRESAAYVKVVRPMKGTVDTDGARTVFRIVNSADGGDYVEWFIQSDGVVVARTVANGGAPTHNTVIHSDWATSGYAWLKLSLASGTVTWWTAPDSGSGTPGTWTSRHTNSTLPDTFASAKVMLWLHHWGTAQGTLVDSARLDGFNTATVGNAAATVTATSSVTAAGQRLALGAASITGESAVTAAGQRLAEGAAALASTSAASAAAQRLAQGHAAIDGTSAVSASVILNPLVAQATITSTSAVTANGTLFTASQDGAATIDGTSGVTAAGQRVVQGAASIGAQAIVTAAAQRLAQGSAEISSVGSASAAGEVYLLLTSYGAVGDGTTNNLTAFQNAFTDSVNTGKTILVTEGVFAFGGDVLRMTGAKMEGLNHNCVIHALSYTTASIFVRGTGTVLRNVKLTTAGTYTRQAQYERTKVAILGATNFTVDRVRIENSPAATIHCAEASNNGVISNCSLYDSKSDTIHITDRCSYIEVHHNEIYRSGDDGIACVSYTYQPTPCHHLTVHHNKVMNNVWGRCISVVGGEDNHYYQNYVEFNPSERAGLIIVAENNVDWQTHACKRIRAEYNTIKNTGSPNVHASVMIFSDGLYTNDDIDIVRNWIIDDRASPAPAVRLFGPQTNVLLDRNKIDNGGAADYEGASGDSDITLILYDSGSFGNTEAVGPAADGGSVQVGQATITAASTVSATAEGIARLGAATVTADSTVAASARRVAQGAAAIAGQSAVTAAAQRIEASGSATISATSSFAANAIKVYTDAPSEIFDGTVGGIWLDPTPLTWFHTTSTSGVAPSGYSATAAGDTGSFGRWLDRSGNGRDATTTAIDTTRPVAINRASPDDWRYYANITDVSLAIANGGGTDTGGFYFAFAGQATNYYGIVFSDASGNTGFELIHDSDGNNTVPQYKFSAGTGSARVTVAIDAGHTLFANPPADSPAVYECLWDGTNISLSRNGGAPVTAACSTVSAGLTTLTINASLAADQKGLEIYEAVSTKNHAPASDVRGRVRDYLTARISGAPIVYRDGSATVSGASAVAVAPSLRMIAQATVDAASTISAAATRVAEVQAQIDALSTVLAGGEVFSSYEDGSAIIAAISSASAAAQVAGLWEPEQDTVGAWTEVSASGGTWTESATPSGTWTPSA